MSLVDSLQRPFEGSRLALLRAKRRITKAELSKRLEVSARMLAFWEAGERVPSFDQTRRLARVLQVLPEYFSREALSVADRDAVSFRALASLTSRQSDSAVATASFAMELSTLLDRDFVLPASRLPVLDANEPEGSAIQLRVELGLGFDPLPNTIHLVESRGVRVFSMGQVGHQVSGMSLWHEDTPFLFVNPMTSGERGRFDVAHELGHLLLHRFAGSVGQAAEKQADRFAAEFLVPAEALLAKPLRWASPDGVVALARTWGVSAMMMVRRLSDARLIRDWESRTLYRHLSAMGFRRGEHGGIARETSQLLTKVHESYRAEGKGLIDLAKQLGWHASDVRSLLLGLVPMVLHEGTSPSRTDNDEAQAGDVPPPRLRLM